MLWWLNKPVLIISCCWLIIQVSCQNKHEKINLLVDDNENNLEEELEVEQLEDLFLTLFQPTIHEESTSPNAKHLKLILDNCAKEIKLPNAEELKNIEKLCPKNEFFYGINPQHMSAVHALKHILRSQTTVIDTICLARALRDRPEINRHVWLRAVMSTAMSREDMSILTRPSLAEIMPSLFIPDEVIKRAKRQTGWSNNRPNNNNNNNGRCSLVNGAVGADNGVENKLWYFREDMLINSNHWYWHLSNPFSFSRLELPQKARPDRRGELFVYFHHQLLARYHTERLTNGMGPARPLMLTPEVVFPGHYNSHLTDANSNRTWTDRAPNTILRSLVSSRNFIRHPSNISIADRLEQINRIEQGIRGGALMDRNGRSVALNNFNGADVLGEVVEASIYSINPDLYGEFGIHNDGHFLIGLVADPNDELRLPPAPMGDPATSMRDPIFYSYHAPIDDIFERHKQALEPYKPTGGEFQLSWPSVQIVGLQVQSLSASPPNVLTTFWNNKNLNLLRGLDFNRSDSAGPAQVCLQHLDHSAFTYQIAINRQSSSPINQKASVRIFMAPRFDGSNQRYKFPDQRKLYFALDYFHVDLNPGPNLITRQSTESTLTIPWPQSLEEVERDRRRQMVYCGCGWPQHMLLPKGTDSGYIFDLFVMVTNADEDLTDGRRSFNNNPAAGGFSSFFGNSGGGCRPAPLYCGIENQKYPDSKPMGYPFDRLPYNIHDPSNSGPARMVGTLDEYISGIPNMAATQVKIVHAGGGQQGGSGSPFTGLPYGFGYGRRNGKRKSHRGRRARPYYGPYAPSYDNSRRVAAAAAFGGYA